MSDADRGKELYETVPEYPDPVKAVIQGEFPNWLEGTLLRVGPGKYEWGKSSYKHWFDGQAIVHRFYAKDSQVYYSSKYVESKSYSKSKKYGRVAMPSFGTWAPPDPCKNIFERFFLYFLPPSMPDNTNINVIDLKDEPFTSTETAYLYPINAVNLDTLEEANLSSKLWGPRNWLAHPHKDNEGNVYNLTTSFIRWCYEVVKLPAKAIDDNSVWSGLQVLSRIRYSGSPAYFHSFGMTDNYFIFVENPFYISSYLKMFFMNLMKWSFFDILKWQPEKPSKIHLVDRKTGDNLKTFTVDTFFAFHHVNAYETETDVIMDVCGYPDVSIIHAFYLHELRNGLKDVTYTMPALRRYRLPTGDIGTKNKRQEPLPQNESGLQYEIIADGFELPRINYDHYNGKQYAHAYGVDFVGHNYFNARLMKVNVNTKEQLIWQEENCYPSEPIFLPSPDAKDEDDGIVLSVVSGVLGKGSFLLILDAKSFKEVARALLPYKVKPTLHGSFWS